MKQRTAIAVGVTAVGILGSGLVAFAAVTGNGLLGFGDATPAAVASAAPATTVGAPVVVTKYESVVERVVVPTAPGTTGTAPADAGTTPPATTAPAPPSATTGSAPSATEPTATTRPPTATTIRAGSEERPTTTTTEAPATTTTTLPATTTTVAAGTAATITKTFGSVDVVYTASSLTITAVHPAAGYGFEVSGHGTYYEIQFQSDFKEYQLRVYVSGGQLRSQVGD